MRNIKRPSLNVYVIFELVLKVLDPINLLEFVSVNFGLKLKAVFFYAVFFKLG